MELSQETEKLIETMRTVFDKWNNLDKKCEDFLVVIKDE